MIQNTKIKRSSIKLTQPPEYTHARINPSILSNNKRLSSKLSAAPRVSALSVNLLGKDALYKPSPSVSPSCSPIPPPPPTTPPPPSVQLQGTALDSTSTDSEDEEEGGPEIEMNEAATMCSMVSGKRDTIWINPIYTGKTPNNLCAPEVSNAAYPSNLSMRSSIGFSNSLARPSLAMRSPLPSQTVLLPQFTVTNNGNNVIFAANGYADVEKVCDTLQGV